ncbi:hypothetical protein EJB05_34149, partial [Eragrostis curvula]
MATGTRGHGARGVQVAAMSGAHVEAPEVTAAQKPAGVHGGARPGSAAAGSGTGKAAEESQDSGLDRNTSFMLRIKLVCNRKARNNAKC